MHTQRFICLFGVLFLSLSLGACEFFEKKDSSRKKVRKFFIHGDPEVLYKGAEANSNSFFKASELDKYSGFALYTFNIFYDKSKRVRSTTQEEIEEENKAPEKDTKKDPDFKFYEKGGIYEYTSKELDFTFSFEKGKGDSLDLYEIAGVPVTPVHYSIDPEASVFSLLVKGEDEDGKFVAEISFTKIYSGITTPTDVDERYNYLMGPGVRAPWPGAIHADICGISDDTMSSFFEENIKKWAFNAGKIADRDLTIGHKKSYLPFSDVNENCIFLLDNFLFENVDDGAVLGITVTLINESQQFIKAADIFISKKGIEKIEKMSKGMAPAEELYQRALIHEFGHFLGLHHEFEEKEGPSIMSYDHDIVSIQKEDKDAISLLYTGQK